MEAPTLPGSQLRTVFEYDSTEAECVATLEFNQLRLNRRLQRSAVAQALNALNLAVWIGFIFLALYFVIERRESSGLWFGGALGALLFLSVLSQIVLRRSTLRTIAAGSESLRGRRTAIVEEGGLRSRGPDGERSVGWNGIRSIEEVAGQILIYLDGFAFIPISASAFVDAAERAALLADLRRRIVPADELTNPVSIAQAESTGVEAGDSQQGPKSEASLSANLIQGIRLAFFLRPIDRIQAPKASWSTLVALVFLSIAIPFLGDFVQVGPKGSFTASALPGVLFVVPVMMVGAWALAWLAGRVGHTLMLLIAMMSLAIPIDVVSVVVQLIAHGNAARLGSMGNYLPYLFNGLATIWFALAATLAAVRLLGVPKRKWLPAFLAVGLLVNLPLGIDRYRTLWSAPYDEEAVGTYQRRRAALANEDVFYLQPRLLRQQLAGLKPGKRGVIDLYFIGVAAYAGQDVFMKEVHSVKRLFDERFGTTGHSLMLINNPATVSESPIASSTSLGLALKRVAEVMDRDEDIVFLFITSHGSKEHEATFDFSPMQLKPIDPGRLKELLDRSGIKRRVVVVSACYSGTFVDVLKDPETLVIAASAADKTSFGCSSGADFTYFGKAYFDEALRETFSFSEAFEIARPVIAERELKGNLRSSDPRMFVGEGIKAALQEFVSLRQAAVKRVQSPSAVRSFTKGH